MQVEATTTMTKGGGVQGEKKKREGGGWQGKDIEGG